MKSGTFHGLPTYILSNDHLTVEILQNAGPRIVRLHPAGREQNLFAELPHKQLPVTWSMFRLGFRVSGQG